MAPTSARGPKPCPEQVRPEASADAGGAGRHIVTGAIDDGYTMDLPVPSRAARRSTRKVAVVGVTVTMSLVAMTVACVFLAQTLGGDERSKDDGVHGDTPTSAQGDLHDEVHHDVEELPPSTTSARRGLQTSSTVGEVGGSMTTERVTHTTTTSRLRGWYATTTVDARCYAFVSNMRLNPLQVYEGNPDSEATGVATLRLCTNGTLEATAFVHNGRSKVIATHIHMASGAGGTGDDGEGPPMINFCGANRRGWLDHSTPYLQECAGWDQHHVAKLGDMAGALVAAFNRGMTLAERVEDIAARPHMYYFNVHTLASWKQWGRTGSARGMCRGTLHRR